MGRVLKDSNVLYLNAQEKVYMTDFTVDGTFGTTNGKRNNAKIALDCKEFIVKDSKTTSTCTAYNVFEQKQTVIYPTEVVKASNVKAYHSLNHNVFNFYNLADNANIEISDCDFDLNVKNSNAMRLANYKNASNVTVTFKNVNWTYDNVAYDPSDIEWAGLILYQPAGADVAYTGDYSYINTWKFVFDNCTYNGEKITSNNDGTIKLAIYVYNCNKSGATGTPDSIGLVTEFK